MRAFIRPKILFTVSAAVCIGPAACLLIAPGLLMSVYGFNLDKAGMFLGRVLGAVLVGLGIVFWRARDTQDKDLQHVAMWAGLAHNILLVIVIVAAVLSGEIIWTGWPAAALHAGLALVFVWLRAIGYIQLDDR